jgi:photosystem II stability/assembly factor-like uncharacterized protein
MGSSAAPAGAAGVSEWTFIGPPSRPAISAIGTDPAFANTVFVATATEGVLRSDDGGATWIAMNAGLPGARVGALLAFRLQPPSPSPCPPPCYGPLVLLAGFDGAGVFRWDGSSWTAANSGLTNLNVTSLAAGSSGPVFAGTLRGGVFRSLDSGVTWSDANSGLTEMWVTSLAASSPAYPPTLYAGTSNGVFRSTDGGATWSASLGGVPGTPFPFGASRVVIAGAVWVIGASNCTYCGRPPSPNGLFKSVDAGQTWSQVQLDGEPLSIGFDPTPPATVFVGMFYSASATPLQQSLDAGQTWLPAASGMAGHRVTTFAAISGRPSTILAGTEAGVYRSGYPPGSVNCVFDPNTLCFHDGRFRARVVWGTSIIPSPFGQAMALTTTTGAFWFFDPTNLELAVKALDGRSINGKFWVFYGSLTNVEFRLTVTDTLTGAVRTYFNPQGQLMSVADTSAF